MNATGIAVAGLFPYRLRPVVVPVPVALLLACVPPPSSGRLRARRAPPFLATWALLLAMVKFETGLQQVQRWLVEEPTHVPPARRIRHSIRLHLPSGTPRSPPRESARAATL